jgi:predicted phosphodiesterase
VSSARPAHFILTKRKTNMRFLLLSDMHFGFNESTHKIWSKYWATKLAVEEWDAIILAGDIGTAKIRHWKSAIRFVTERANDKPIYHVRGNHDLWDRQNRELLHLIGMQQEFARKHNVHLLQDFGSTLLDGVLLTGWDGWYANPTRLNTNDFNFIPQYLTDEFGNIRDTDSWLSARAYNGADTCIQDLLIHNGPKVVVTHMPCLPGMGNPEYNANPRFGEQLVGHADVLVWGHSHTRTDITIQGTRILNCGADYNKPNHLFFEVNNADQP